MNLEQKIEAILYWKGEPMSRKKLADMLKSGPAELNGAIDKLKASLAGRGVVLIERESKVSLGTPPELSKLFEDLQKEELNRGLSKASLETLSIILYKNGASRADIDYVRGVNSSFTIRALSVRGLVERVPDPADSRRFLYRPSLELLSYMGLSSIADLPEYADINPRVESAAAEGAEELRRAEEEARKENETQHQDPH